MSLVSKGSDAADIIAHDEWSCLRDHQTSIVARATGDLSRGSRELELTQGILLPEQTANVQSQKKCSG